MSWSAPILLGLCFGLLAQAPSGAAEPSVANVSLSEQGDRVWVQYDLAGSRPAPIRLVGSGDGGKTFGLPVRSVSGDVGPAVEPGLARRIEWQYRKDMAEGLARLDVVIDVWVDVPRYFVVPLRGRFGVELDEGLLQECLDRAAGAAPSVVVLEIESPGGSVLEMEDMLDLLQSWREEYPHVRVVSLVRGQATHAAALFASATDGLYLLPGVVMGAGDDPNPGGLEVAAIDRVFPGRVYQKARQLAEKRGAEPLLVEAMVFPLRLAVATEGEQRVTSLKKTAPLPTAHRLLSDGTGLLRLSAQEAVDLKLADGVVRDLDDLGGRLGTPAWTAVGTASAVMEEVAEETRQALEEYERVSTLFRDALADFEDARAAGRPALRDAQETHELLEDLKSLSEDYPFVGQRLQADFRGGIAPLQARCDQALATAQVAAQSASQKPRRWSFVRSRSGGRSVGRG